MRQLRSTAIVAIDNGDTDLAAPVVWSGMLSNNSIFSFIVLD